MKQSVNLCTLSIHDFHPHYTEIKQNSMTYTNNITAAQYFNDSISMIPNFSPISENPTITDLQKIVDQASLFLRNGEKLKSKLLFKNLPHLFTYIHFEKNNTNKLLQSLNQIYTDFPTKSFIQYPLAILLILRDNATSKYTFLFYHLLSMPKFLLNPIISIFLNGNSRNIEKYFILSTFLPSFEFDIPNLVRPEDNYIIPDPLQMADHISEFTDEQLGYACHVMQICHHYLLSIINTNDLNIENFMPLLYLVGSSSFSRCCFSLSILITSQIPSENSNIIQFIQKVQEFGCIALIEELFLYNTSESFSHFIPISGNFFYPFFVANFDNLSPEMKTVMTSLSLDLKESAQQLNKLSNHSGNRVYLYWIYIFLTRLVSKMEKDEVRIEIVRNYWILIKSHIQKVYLLIESAEKFKDPSINFLLNSTLCSIFNYLHIIIKKGTINEYFVNNVYDFVIRSLHFIISTPVIINKVTSLACELLKTYQSIQNILYKQPLLFKRCILTFSDSDAYQSPAIALAMSNIHVPVSFISKLANLLILADEPTCFYCLSSLINSCQKLNELAIFLIQFLHNLIYLKNHRDIEFQNKILMRYFLLLCSLILNNDKFPKIFVTCDHFEAFDHLFRFVIHEAIAFKNETLLLQEAIIFFLHALYQSFIKLEDNDNKFTYFQSYQMESFLKNIEFYSKTAANMLLEGIVDFLRLYHFKNSLSMGFFHNIKRSQASNKQWFIDIIKNLNTVNLAQIPRPKICKAFSLPWKQNYHYSSLLSSSYHGAAFQKITK